MEENTNNSNDRSKVLMLVSLIIVVSILIVGFVFLAVIDLTRKDAESRLRTTSRRTVATNQKEESSENPQPVEAVEPTSEVDVVTTTTKVTTGKITTQRVTTTKKVEEVIPEQDYEESVIPSNDYEVATSASTYPDALDSWEWEIVNMVNAERRKNGLNELLVARELRDKAEEGAYIYYANGANQLKSYLEGYSYLYMFSNLNIGPETLYDNTVSSTKVTTNPNLRYVGVGVIKKNTSLDTYFYVITYE